MDFTDFRKPGSVNAEVALLLPDPDAAQPLLPYPFNTVEVSDKEASVAAWAHRNRKPTGRETDTLPSSGAISWPLVTPDGCEGGVGLKPKDGRSWSLQQRNPSGERKPAGGPGSSFQCTCTTAFLRRSGAEAVYSPRSWRAASHASNARLRSLPQR